ncbi:DEKNAAC102426 [Brettanomyces naardenensis]|uniref:DEKNAAC102426 n=1 Tax=Brettanomyces naardenensis TaxID=13370 RepID=A0A448YLF6_BRENA|nr:DEKNAAC102426 [Brettanomyces naardenensis]
MEAAMSTVGRRRQQQQHATLDGVAQSNLSMALDQSAFIDVTQETPINAVADPMVQSYPQARYGGGPNSRMNSMGNMPSPMNMSANGRMMSLNNMARPLRHGMGGGVGGGGDSRHGSFTSMVSKNHRFLKHRFSKPSVNGGGGGNEDYDDFNGDSNIDATTDPDISLSDLKHLRGGGRYGTGSNGSADTVPYIPTYDTSNPPSSSGNNSSNGRGGMMSNTSYRKQQVMQKKLMAMRYSRMAQQGQPGAADANGNANANAPRSMSLQSFSQYRPMNPQMNGVSGPPAPQGPPGPQGYPHLNSLGVMPQNYNAPPVGAPAGGYPRTMSMQSAGYARGGNAGGNQRFMPPQSQFMRPPFGNPNPGRRNMYMSSSQPSLQQVPPPQYQRPQDQMHRNSLTQLQADPRQIDPRYRPSQFQPMPAYSTSEQQISEERLPQPELEPVREPEPVSEYQPVPEYQPSREPLPVHKQFAPQAATQMSTEESAPQPSVPQQYSAPLAFEASPQQFAPQTSVLPQRMDKRPLASLPSPSKSLYGQSSPVHSRISGSSYDPSITQPLSISSPVEERSQPFLSTPVRDQTSPRPALRSLPQEKSSNLSNVPPPVFQPQAGKVKVSRYVFGDSDEEDEEEDDDDDDMPALKEAVSESSATSSRPISIHSPTAIKPVAAEMQEDPFFSADEYPPRKPGDSASPDGRNSSSEDFKEPAAPALMNDGSSYASSSTSYDSDSICKTPDITLKNATATEDEASKLNSASSESLDFTRSPEQQSKQIVLPESQSEESQDEVKSVDYGEGAIGLDENKSPVNQSSPVVAATESLDESVPSTQSPPGTPYKVKSMIPEHINLEPIANLSPHNFTPGFQHRDLPPEPQEVRVEATADGPNSINSAGGFSNEGNISRKTGRASRTSSNVASSPYRIHNANASSSSTFHRHAVSNVSSGSSRKPPPLPKEGITDYLPSKTPASNSSPTRALKQRHTSSSTLSSIENAFSKSPRVVGAKQFFMKITQGHMFHSQKTDKKGEKESQKSSFSVHVSPVPGDNLGQPTHIANAAISTVTPSVKEVVEAGTDDSATISSALPPVPPKPLPKDAELRQSHTPEDWLLNYRLTLHIPHDDESDHRLSKFLDLHVNLDDDKEKPDGDYESTVDTEPKKDVPIVEPKEEQVQSPPSPPSPKPLPSPPTAPAQDPVTEVNMSPDLREYMNPSQLGVLNDSNELMKELQIVSTELAGSISREFALESKMRSNIPLDGPTVKETETSAKLSELVATLAEERWKRYATEELLFKMSHGVSENSQLADLGYKNSALRKRVLELEEGLRSDKTIMEMLKEEKNSLKAKLDDVSRKYRNLTNNVVPELKNQVEILSNSKAPQNSLEERLASLRLENGSLKQLQISGSDEATVLKSQRDSLREALKSMKAQRDMDFRMNAEKIKLQEQMVNKLSLLNSELSRKLLTAGLISESELSLASSPSLLNNTSFEKVQSKD